MDHAMAEARRLGFKTILLTTATVLKEAVGLYESRGFSRFHWPYMSSRCDALPIGRICDQEFEDTLDVGAGLSAQSKRCPKVKKGRPCFNGVCSRLGGAMN
jgi:hypothetical protein